jgi:hypothetical protein
MFNSVRQHVPTNFLGGHHYVRSIETLQKYWNQSTDYDSSDLGFSSIAESFGLSSSFHHCLCFDQLFNLPHNLKKKHQNLPTVTISYIWVKLLTKLLIYLGAEIRHICWNWRNTAGSFLLTLHWNSHIRICIALFQIIITLAKLPHGLRAWDLYCD